MGCSHGSMRFNFVKSIQGRSCVPMRYRLSEIDAAGLRDFVLCDL